MASRATLLLLLQTAFVVAVALAWRIEGVRGEEAEALGLELVTPMALDKPSAFVRRQLIGTAFAGGWSRRRSCIVGTGVCPSAGSSCCNHLCTNVKNDHSNCGACGNKCISPKTCCGGKCVSLLTDQNNCGRCGEKCHANGCEYGVCQYNTGWGYKYGGETTD